MNYLMNKYKNTANDIHKRIYNFVINCFNEVIKNIPKSVENNNIIKQLTASLTSIGANDQEADASITKKDFIAKYTIAKKEAKETRYWLFVVRDTKILKDVDLNIFINECQEILLIISKIIYNTKKSIHL